MEVIPAIDLKGGRCVRLFQGDFQRETVFSADPLAVARDWQQQGAPRLHLVDLDGAANGTPANLPIIAAIAARLSIPVQMGGGIRDRETADRLITAGIQRVVIGTAALENPALIAGLCRDYGGDRVVAAVDARDGWVSIKGWTESSQVTALDLARQMAALGVPRLLYTDIARDGTLTAPNIAATAELAAKTGLAVQASGGVATLEHLRELAGLGVEAAIVGSALYRGTLDLPAALAAAAGGGGS